MLCGDIKLRPTEMMMMLMMMSSTLCGIIHRSHMFDIAAIIRTHMDMFAESVFDQCAFLLTCPKHIDDKSYTSRTQTHSLVCGIL